MEDILLHQPTTRAGAFLLGSLQSSYHLRMAGSFKELERLLSQVQPQACILDIFGPPRLSLPALRRLRGKHPSIALVIASDFAGREMDLYHLGRLSVDGVVRMDQSPSSREIVGIVNGAIAGALANNVVGKVGNDLPALAQEVIRWAIERAESRPQVSRLAASLAMSPRALLRELKALDLVSPRSLLLWGRLIRASQLLDKSSATVEGIAFRMGYATGGALGKAFKRHVGCSPTGLSKRGGLAWTLEVFQRKGLRRPAAERDRWANTRSPRWRFVRAKPEVR